MVELDNICSVEQVDAVIAELDRFESERNMRGCVASFVRSGQRSPSAVASYEFAVRHQTELINDGNYANIRDRAFYESLREQLAKSPEKA